MVSFREGISAEVIQSQPDSALPRILERLKVYDAQVGGPEVGGRSMLSFGVPR